MNVRKGDTVYVIAGKDKGIRGKVIRTIPAKDQVVVEGVHRQKRHQKPSAKVMQGGIITKEGPIHVSNVMVYCSSCHRPVRVRSTVGEDGKRMRVCGECAAALD